MGTTWGQHGDNMGTWGHGDIPISGSQQPEVIRKIIASGAKVLYFNTDSSIYKNMEDFNRLFKRDGDGHCSLITHFFTPRFQ
jgi:flavodoxin